MDITWDEADPRHLFGVLLQKCVRLNGKDVGVWDIWKAHIDVCDWDEDKGAHGGVNVRSIPWDEVQQIHVY